MGTLYIVATPIGNLKDITLRAIETLKTVDLIVCEDTRVFGKLAKEYGIGTRLVSMNDFNEQSRFFQIIGEMASGVSVALVSDAGTPLVSDPGYKLVRGALEKGISVESIPGPSAAVSALTVSGLPPDKFLFLGYLPKKVNGRRETLEKLGQMLKITKFTAIFFESPHRLVETLKMILDIFGDIDIVICREMTKLHEEVRREKVSLSLDHFLRNAAKGEFVLLI